MKHHRLKINKNLRLTEVREDDLDSLAFHINDKVIYDNTLVIPYPYTVDDAQSFLDHVREFEKTHNKQKDWAIRYDKEMVGGIGILYNYGMESHRTEIGYWLGQQYRNKGIMTSVLKSFSKLCLQKLGFHRIEAQVFEDNLASRKALEKANFNQEGFLLKAYIKDGQFKNAYQYSRVKK